MWSGFGNTLQCVMSSAVCFTMLQIVAVYLLCLQQPFGSPILEYCPVHCLVI